MKVPFPLRSFSGEGSRTRYTVYSKRTHMGGWCQPNCWIPMTLAWLAPCVVCVLTVTRSHWFLLWLQLHWCHWLNHSLSLPEGWVLAETGRKQLAQPLHNTLHPSILTSFVILEMVEKQTWQLHVWWYHRVYNCKTIGQSSCRHTSMRYHQRSNNKCDRQEVCIYSIPEITVILQWQNKYQNTRTSAKGLKKRHLVPGPSHAAF